MSLNDQDYNKYRSLELRQFISSKLHFNHNNSNFNSGNNNSAQLDDYQSQCAKTDTNYNRFRSPFKRANSKTQKQNSRRESIKQMEELRKLTAKSCMDKPYSLSLLNNKTHDQKAKKMQRPINITEQLIPRNKKSDSMDL